MSSKRITLLTRNMSMSMAEFRDHWAHPHAEIARRFPGLVRYHQSHVTRSNAPGDDSEWPVHGVVELWFRDAAALAEAGKSSVTQELIVDEPKFLSRMTGLAIVDSVPPDDAMHRVFVLSQPTGDEGDTEAELRKLLGALPNASSIYVGRAGDIMRRDTLPSDENPSKLVAFASFATTQKAGEGFKAVMSAVDHASASVRDSEIYLSEGIRIV